jgi:hypothetical protein
MVDVNKAKQEALKEVNEEREKEAKIKIKSKLLELEKARKIVKNIERELEDLYDELSQD